MELISMSLTKRYMEDISASIGFDGKFNSLVITYCEFLNELSDYLQEDSKEEDKIKILDYFLHGNIVRNDLPYRYSSHDIINKAIEKHDLTSITEYDKIRSKHNGRSQEI